ncbi:MAG TPA: 2-amino-4-hydroxy-6-hydroxymethyldihydropteridine diphosphokinase [Methyloceanibacter sp.]|nr:2-amino-4-hydroxy-6-hydroxymethyldihydropteridine diphosphokinase [Methyloceanibacter sp.]
MTPQLPGRAKVVVALGANSPGPWGTPEQTIAQALGEIARANIDVVAVSPRYRTAAVGGARQPSYVNAVALLDTRLPPESLLRVLKAVERRAGRRGGRPWGPRTLDIDIIDYAGLVRHWRKGQSPFARAGTRPLVLPHPLAHRRPFVLKPLLDVAPSWRHPALRQSVRALWSQVSRQREGRVLRCHEAPR